MHVLAFLIALMAVLTSQHPDRQQTVYPAAEAPGVGAARIGPPTLDFGSRHRAIEDEHTVEAVGDPLSRPSFVSGSIALGSHAPPARQLHGFALQSPTRSPITGRSALVSAPKTSPPATRS